MEAALNRIIEQIFNNWSALKLAVEHSMGGSDSRQVAENFKNYVVNYCLTVANAQAEDIQEVLEDIMDEEFETICEDNSPKEIATLIYRFMNLLKEGNLEQCEVEFNNLPKLNEEWLIQTRSQIPKAVVEEQESEETASSNQTTMEEDEWTEVKSRRKR